MARYVVRRLIQAIPILIGISIIIFFIVHLGARATRSTGSGPQVSPEVIENLRRVYGLDQPLPVQFVKWFTPFWTFPWDPTAWGYSHHRRPARPRQDLRAGPEHAPADGDGADPHDHHRDPGRDPGRRQPVQQVADKAIAVVTTIGYALPTFWLGSSSARSSPSSCDLFPLFGKHTFGKEGDIPRPHVAPLPARPDAHDRRRRRLEPLHAGLACSTCCGQDYIRTAQGQGRRRSSRVIFKHALRNALIPIVTLLGPDDPDAARGRRHHRGGLLVARASAAWAYHRDHGARLPHGPRLRDDRRHLGHPRQPAGRHPLRRRRPADQVLGGATMESAQTTRLPGAAAPRPRSTRSTSSRSARTGSSSASGSSATGWRSSRFFTADHPHRHRDHRARPDAATRTRRRTSA